MTVWFIVASFYSHDLFGIGVKRRAPELVEPFAQRAQAVRVDVIDAPRPLGPIGDEACIFQHAQMLRHRRAADRQAAGQSADRFRSGAQLLEHPAPGWIGQRGQRIIVSHG
jgi:hypothetical protein